MKRVTVFLAEQQISALQAMATATGLKFAEVLRRMIDEAIEDYNARQRQREAPRG